MRCLRIVDGTGEPLVPGRLERLDGGLEGRPAPDMRLDFGDRADEELLVPRVVAQVEALVGAGIPVMAHLGFTPQSEHSLGGYRVQGRGERGDALLADALALQAAGAFALVLELVPALLAKRVTAELAIPTIGIGAGPDCDAQVLVWQDMAGLSASPGPRFVKRYADLRGVLAGAAAAYAEDVRVGRYPDTDHSYS